MTRRLEPEDLYAIKLVDDPQITPDGQRVAYVVVEIDRKTYDYHRTIWVSDTAQSLPRRYTAGDNDTTPDGRRTAARSCLCVPRPARSSPRMKKSAIAA